MSKQTIKYILGGYIAGAEVFVRLSQNNDCTYTTSTKNCNQTEATIFETEKDAQMVLDSMRHGIAKRLSIIPITYLSPQ